MYKTFTCLVVSVFVLALSNTLSSQCAEAGPMLKMVEIKTDAPGQIKKLARMGLDISEIEKESVIVGPRGVPFQSYRVQAVVSALDQKKLGFEGFSWSDVPGKGPVKKIGDEYTVYKSFDAPRNGIKAQLRSIHSNHQKICQIKTIGYSIQDRPLLAMRITNEKIKGEKHQVLFLATHHAREWVATQMAMRLITYLTENFAKDSRVTDLLNSTEIWVIPVANPDGYQYTFTNERLWRKNLRDNDNDGQITLADGVDLNRNFASHWGLDEEGSSPIPSSGTYRGTAPNSEPETQAVVDFIRQHDFKYILSYHTHGNLILYPLGWQVKTASLDDPIFVAQAGTDVNPAIYDSIAGEGYDPGVGADLYITNGDFTDWTYGELGIPSHTVEFTTGYDFRFPDDEEMVQTVFEDSLNFAISVAESASNPGYPVSPVGIPVNDIYHTPLSTSYGPSQIVEVLARKGVDLTLCVNGSCCNDCFSEQLGSIYNEKPGTYFSRYVAIIDEQNTGDHVTYEINGGSTSLGPYSYTVANDSGNLILVVSAEDYSGEYPAYDPGGPFYLDYYTNSLDAEGYNYDVWDVDLLGVPSYTEVLSHYELAIWYTGDDYAPTVPNGFMTHDQQNRSFRDFLNYNQGNLFATGQDIAWISAVYGQFEEIPDDFFQYYLGAYIDLDEGGVDPDTHTAYGVVGQAGDPILDGVSFELSGGDGADNQCCSSTFLSTNYFLPHYEGTVAAKYNRPGGPTSPYSGSYYVYSRMADMSFKRIGGVFTIPPGAPTLSFRISYDIETNWDYAFIEIAESGTDNWTTLQDINGLTTQNTGDSCISGWVEEIHPFLEHYMDEACLPSGTTGDWHALTGTSGGWQQVVFDLSAFAGQTVELYISYATDWATQNLGAFIDDIELSGYPIEDFETGLNAWTPVSPPEGSEAFNNWERMTGAGFPEGPVIRTDNTVYFGFGFEAIDSSESRNLVMKRVLEYFGLYPQ